MGDRELWKHAPQLVAQARAAACLRLANRAIASVGAPLVEVLAGLSRHLERKTRD
jgi:hypothetical protein